MNKSDLATRLAKLTHLSKAEAADQLDRVINSIIFDLRKGKSARLPGLGSFRPGKKKWRFRFDAEIRRAGKRATE